MKLFSNITGGQQGVTLVELIMAIVIISVALSGVLLVMNFTTAHSADPMLEHQAVAIAESYLEEILLRPIADPGGGPEGGRTDFDNVADYNGLNDNGARDQFDIPVVGLGAYQVQVAVQNTALGSPAVPMADCLKVDVTVTHPSGINMTLTGYRTDY